MCDYSLHLVASRPAKVGDKLVATDFVKSFSLFGRACVDHKVARFRQVNMDDPHVHHDALEFPSGQIVKVTRLVAGQRATVLQLPASTRDHGGARESAHGSSTGRIEA